MGDTGRVPALDAIRGLAILLVVVGHAGIPGIEPAAVIGVSVFFVLSGYLITGLLLARPHLRDFYLRRAARLLPALVVMLALLAVLAEAVGSDAMRHDAIPALFYYANWSAASGVDLHTLEHTWSLAVEEQFYLAWPLLLLAVPRHRLVPVLCVIVAASLALRFTVAPGHAGTGTDTNAYALALGGLLALRSRFPTWATWCGLLLIAVDVPLGTGRWCAVVAAVAAVGLVGARDLPSPPWLQHLGRVSYGWYLWHFPLLKLVGPDDWRGAVPVSLLALGIAEASYRWVEMPVRRWAVRRAGGPLSGATELERLQAHVVRS